MSDFLEVESWLTGKAVESLASYFTDGQVNGMGNWTEELRILTTRSAELEEVLGMHHNRSSNSSNNNNNTGIKALSRAISSVEDRPVEEGPEAVLLMEVRESRDNQNQVAHLRMAADALNDLCNVRMYDRGHPKNVGLLEEASTNAKRAARAARGSLMTKLQAFRIWVAVEYMHEAATKSCLEAKNTAMKIVGRVILQDHDLVDICDKYSLAPTSGRSSPPDPIDVSPSEHEGSWRGWSGSTDGGTMPLVVARAIEFILEIVSSVSLLPPLNEDTSCPNVIEMEGVERGEGELTLGLGVPDNVVFAIGRYCASNPDMVMTYPAVSALGMEAFDAGKERMALDTLFAGMGGEHWILKGGWKDREGELSDRFGIATENGHVTKISLAGNNLQGALHESLADCEHLRELVLHGNCVAGAIPARVQALMNRKPDMVVTGLSPADHRVVPYPNDHGSSITSDSGGSYSCEEGYARERVPYAREPLLGEVTPPPDDWSAFASTTNSSTDVDTEAGASKNTTMRKRSVSLLRRGFKYAKEATASDFTMPRIVMNHPTCPTCRARLTARTDAHPQCDTCAPQQSA